MQTLHVHLASLTVAMVVALLSWLVSRWCVLHREKWSWRLISTAQIAAAFGSGFQACTLSGLSGNLPLAAAAEFAWVVQFPLLSLGLVLQCPGHPEKRVLLARFLDLSLFALGATWLALLSSATPGPGTAVEPLAATLHLARPLGNVILASGLLYMLLGWEQFQVPISALHLVGAMALRVLVGVLEGLLPVPPLQGQGTNLLSAEWVIVWLILGVVAADRLRAEDVARSASGLGTAIEVPWLLLVRSAIAYLPLPIALLLWLLPDQSHAQRVETALIPALMAVVVVLLTLRLLMIAWESYTNGRFTSSLSQQLQSRVVQQALQTVSHNHDLDILSDVAAQLADCTTPEATVSKGLELAAEALNLPAGVLWTRSDDGRMDLAAHRGLRGHSAELSLADLPNRAPTLSQALLTGSPTVVHDADFLSHPTIAGAFQHSPSGLLIVPLLSRRTIVGALGLVTDEGSALGGSRVQLAEVIGAQLAAALDNAARYESIRHMADRDPLTGLFNHRATHEQLERELGRTRRAGSQLAVVMADVDSFKLFNDNYGHLAGDRVLQTVAFLLLRTARASDIVGRLGGDEFLVILADTETSGAMNFAQRVKTDLAKHAYVADGRRVPITMSIGLAAYPNNGSTVQELLRCADANMYTAKRNGDDTVAVNPHFDPLSPRHGEVFGVLDGLVTAIDGKDHYTRRHSEDVTTYALVIAEQMELSQARLRTLRVAGLLHDVGKIGVPTDLLRKPARFAEEEAAIMRQHVQLGEMIISGIPNVAEIRAAVAAHHERIDGQGYPRNLAREEIPLAGRILAVADTFSAMTSNRPYRQALSLEESKKELRRVAGAQLDPALVELFLEALERKDMPLRLQSS